MRRQWRKAFGYAIGAAMLVASAGLVRADVITIGASADAEVSNGGAFLENMNRGGELSTYIGDAGAFFKALVRFDISAIPAGQQITSATLKLTINSGESQVDGAIHRINASWEEGTNSYPTAGGAGVTWHTRGTALPNWVSPGLNDPADRNPTPSASFGAANVTAGVLSINLTSDVQAWYSGLQANHGWVLVRTAASGYTGYRTREYSPEFGPQLTIEYQPVPEPASIAMLGGAALLLARRNRAVR